MTFDLTYIFSNVNRHLARSYAGPPWLDLGQIRSQGHRLMFTVTGGNNSSTTAGMADRDKAVATAENKQY